MERIIALDKWLLNSALLGVPNMVNTFDLTPDPKVLIALTHTPIRPLDALCELIDNSIDSFASATVHGDPIEHPVITIDLPKATNITRETGSIVVRDNGPGLSPEMAEKSVRAGFSGNNPFDNLGLFGMGFNISTGKLGSVTKLLTARATDEKAIEVVIDLETMRTSGSYKVPFTGVHKPGFVGTQVEISNWWPKGNPNNGFVRRLVQYGMPVVRREIGRRYATILRDRKIRIVINGEPCEPFEHCAWSESRYVERREHGRIPAKYVFDHIVGSQKRCSVCTVLVPPNENHCPNCGSGSLRTLDERIRGWVGIQRFDDQTEFGIDLVRRGRAIRIGEKAAFFEYVDELKQVTKDYPIDQIYGRIIGEVHLDHVPVDFLKEDFQRSSPEWQRAMSFLRGDSPLQPNKPGADTNESPIFKLYQGYRRVRTPGKTDMYMGFWNESKGKPDRISRDIEREYYEKFKRKEPGFYDDTEWWKLVEKAETRPPEELIECPECKSQNIRTAEVCLACDHILIGKNCINPTCQKLIPKSAVTCPNCGSSQLLEVEEPWTCQVCFTRNRPGTNTCSGCQEPRGTENMMSKEYLLRHSNKTDALSIQGCSVVLADGSHSQPINVDTYVTRGPITPNLNKSRRIPAVVFKGERIEFFADTSHPVFTSLHMRPEEMIAAEVALYIYDTNRRLATEQYRGLHTLSTIQWTILNDYWAEVLEDSAERVRADIESFISNLRTRLPVLLREFARDFYTELDDEQKKSLVSNIMDSGVDIGQLTDMRDSGQYLLYVTGDTIVQAFSKYPAQFFDGGFWHTSFASVDDLPSNILEDIRNRVQSTYLNCLEDIVRFSKYKSVPESVSVAQRARISLDFLLQKVV